MYVDPWPDLALQITRRRWRCVPDPLLCLSASGAAFLQGLALHAEVWLTPELLNILDHWPVYDHDPELLGVPAADGTRDALRILSCLRNDAGHVGGPLCWISDALRESRLPAGVGESIVSRWEAMAEALDERLSTAAEASGAEASGPLIAAFRDTAALHAVLPGAVILTRRQPEEPDLPPVICRHLEAWRLTCRELFPHNDFVALERNLLQHLMVEAGVAGFLWGGLDLSVLHLVVPGHARLPLSFPSAEDDGVLLAQDEPRPIPHAWQDAKAFWYDLAPGSDNAVR
jgi:hypothetical protein